MVEQTIVHIAGSKRGGQAVELRGSAGESSAIGRIHRQRFRHQEAVLARESQSSSVSFLRFRAVDGSGGARSRRPR